jgi:serine protease Do
VSSGGPYTLNVETELSGDEVLNTTGLLAEGDPSARDQSLYDAYPLEVTGGSTYIVTMRSEDFDTYLLLVDPETEARVATNDDAFGTDSRLVWTAPNDGHYEVWANSYQAGETGQYRIEIRELGK